VAGSEINSTMQLSHVDRHADDLAWDRGSYLEPREAILVLWQHLAIKEHSVIDKRRCDVICYLLTAVGFFPTRWQWSINKK